MKRVEDTKQGAMQELDRKKEIGRFSMEWSEKTFDELFDFLSTGTNSRSDLSLYGDVGYIHYGDIHSKWNKFLDCDKEELPKISKQKVKNLPFLKEGDLILADASEDYVGIGACILLKNVKTRKIVSGLHTILLRSHNAKLSPVYSAYLTSIRDVKDKLISITTGISVYGLSKNQLKKIKVYLPSDIKEQTTIAQILSDTDDLIQQIDYLITKKKNIKQGAMQELLTGKRRLFGFSGKWEVVEIGNHIDLLTGFPFSSNYYSKNGIRLLRGSNIKRNHIDWSENITEYWEKLTPDLKKYVLEDGDIVIAMDGSLVGMSFARLSKKDLPALLLQRVARIRSNSINMDYLKEYVCSNYFTKYCDSVKTVTAIPHISPKDIRKFSIPVPPTKEEQSAIAKIISNMDTEIEKLEKNKEKYIMLKNGMMQKLITGEIRIK